MKKNQRYIMVFVLLVLSGLLLGKTEYFSTYVLEPIVRILWQFYLIIRSVDQKTYWVMLIFAVLPLVIRLLPESRSFSRKPEYNSIHQNNDRVLYWDALIKAAEKSKYDRLRLQRSLQTLSQSIEALSFGNNQKAILLPSMKTGFRGWVQKAGCKFFLFQHVKRKNNHRVSELEICIDQVLKSIELHMESYHD